jgi:pimeloyl-ACP methyl ester carboxylesterase
MIPAMAPIELLVPGATLHGERRESRYEDVPPLIALHAGVADSRSWSATFDLLEGLPTLVAYDRRGYGASPLPDVGYDSLDDLASVLNQTTAGRVWLLGNSLGGRLALDLAVTQPDRVAGLILLSPGVSGAPEIEFDETTALLFDVAVRAYEAGDLASAAAIEAQIWLDGPAAAEGRVAGAARSLALEMNMAALASDTHRERLERDPGILAWDRLQRLAMPVTVACGLLDVGAVIDQGRAIADRIPGAQFSELEDVAHLPALEAPERVAELVRRAVLAT